MEIAVSARAVVGLRLPGSEAMAMTTSFAPVLTPAEPPQPVTVAVRPRATAAPARRTRRSLVTARDPAPGLGSGASLLTMVTSKEAASRRRVSEH
jgi:hypothetical protein